jgi:hypothetical protein
MILRKLLLILVLATIVTALISGYAVAATQTLTGVVTDTMCGKKHTMAPGKPDADCVRGCVKAGASYALLVGDKLYTLKGDAKQIDPFAAKKATVKGEVNGNAIVVSAIAEAK